MSLPEYSQHHWQDLDRLVEWGADGFELAASSPRGLEFPRARLERVAALCRARGLLALAATDNHGYGGAACVWNIVRLPGWRALGPDEIQIQLIAALRRGGFASARAVERPRLEVPRDWTVWLHGPRALFDAYRRLPWLHCFFTFVFIWAVWLFPRSEGKIRAHP